MNTTMTVGIGTTVPVRKLDVRSDESDTRVRILNTLAQGRTWELTSGGNAMVGAFSINDYTAGTDRYRFLIDASGNVGVGTTTPAFMLDVAGDINAAQAVHIGSGGTYSPGTIYSNANWGMILRGKQAGALGAFTLRNSADTELVRIVEQGNVGIGKAPRTIAKLEIDTSGDKSLYMMDTGYGGLLIGYQGSTIQARSVMDSNLEALRLQNRNGVVTIGNPLIDGSATHALFVQGDVYARNNKLTSDKRWKDNIVEIQGALEKIMRLRGVEYTWKREEFKDMDFPDGRQIGMIAQEVEKEFPELVSTNSQGYKFLAYDKMTAVLLEAVKSQQKEIGELKKQNDKSLIDAQQREIDLLKARLDKLEKQ